MEETVDPTHVVGNGSNRTTTDPVSLLIFHLVLTATSEIFLKNLLLVCCVTTLVIVLVIAFSRMSKMRMALLKLARRVGLIEKYHVYTIFDERKTKDIDGTKSAVEDFEYVSMIS